MRVLVLALLVTAMLSGCSGGGSEAVAEDDTGPKVRVQGEEGRDTGGEQSATGDLVGRVRDDANFSIEAARLALAGTDAFDTTGEDGRFSLTAPAGEYILRVSAPEFRVLEERVQVVAGTVRELEIELDWRDDRGGGYRAHVHDFWDGKDRYTLLDDDLDLSEERGPNRLPPGSYAVNSHQWANQGRQGEFEVYLPPAEPGHPSMVIPGTARIHVTLTWSSDEIAADRMGVSYIPANSKDTTHLDSKTSGETTSFDVTPDMTDSGHQLWTMWQFFLYIDNDVGEPLAWKPTTPGTVHVEIVLEREEGVVPFERPHEDWWGSNTTLVLRDGTQEHSSLGFCCRIKNSVTGISLPDGVIVPPGTERIRFRLDWSYANAAGVADKDFRLFWRTADQDPANTGYEDLHRADPTEEGDHFRIYELELESGQEDQFYQQKSNWLWVPDPEGEDQVPNHVDKPTPRFALHVQVWKDPEFT